MIQTSTLIYKGRIYRARYRRGMRMIFPSPAEMRFIEIMNGRYTSLQFIKHPRTHFPLTIVWTLGPLLHGEHVRREVRVGKYFIDFGNDIKRGIEIDGMKFHQDILKEQSRDQYLFDMDWLILHIRAHRLWSEPDVAKRETRLFLWEGRRH
jgi:hypothetical protein